MRANLVAAAAFLLASPAFADPLTVVSWNIGPGLEEPMLLRKADFTALDAELSPDVIVMVEVIGRRGAEIVADHLGWSEYHVAVSDLAVPTTAAHEGLEVAVISKIPIVAATEYDAVLDGNAHDVFGTFGSVQVPEKLLTSSGISGVELTGDNDRGTLRIDLANGVTILPVHLKSNVNNACGNAKSAKATLGGMSIDVPQKLVDAIANGFENQVKADKRNAAQRERVAAAVKIVADQAASEGRTVIIAGDYNTSFEAGKVGTAFADCDLKPYACKEAPFPADKCVNGDGFDDTFAILSKPLVGSEKLTVLTEGLGRTYKDTVFADAAIDHLAVQESKRSMFRAPSLTCSGAPATSTSGAVRSCELHGSDHFAIATEYVP